MSEREYQSRLQSLKPFLTLLTVVIGSALLASCGGGGSSDPTASSATADGAMKTAQAVSGSTTVPGTWKGRPSPINESGPIPVDTKQIIPSDGKSTDKSGGVVANQVWIEGAGITKDQLFSIVASYPSLKIVAYRASGAVLVQFDKSNSSAVSDLNEISKKPGILDVYARTVLPAPRSMFFSPADKIPPNDGSNFNDGGDNWHLEAINALGAWRQEAGVSENTIGVMDAGFYEHTEIATRVAGTIGGYFSGDKTTELGLLANHGTSSAATIGAQANNTFGMTGINWRSKLILATLSASNDSEEIKNKYADIMTSVVKPRVINFSFGVMGDPTNVAAAIAATRPIRTLMVKNPNTIHVWAAGNGASDGLGLGVVASNQNGALHLASDSTERRLGNVIVVGAMLRNGKLASYSAYGGLVDVAAPTEFKGTNGTNAFTVSAEYGVATIPKNGNFLLGTASFSGTSAAAPVVTGIISLILDANPDLTPADVKKILISTASKKITKRETSLLGGEEDTPQIPIVDAEAAVKEAIKRRTLPACENQINIINRGSDFNINDDASWGSPTCKSGAIHVTARASSGNIYFKIDNPSLTATYSYGCDKSATSWYCNGYVPFTEVLLDANNDGQVTPGTDFSLSIGTRDYGDDELQSRSCQVWYPPNYTPWIPNAPIGYRTTPYVFSGAVRRISETSSYGMSIDACGSINLVFSSSAAGDTPHYIISMKNSFSSINQSDAGAKMFRVRLREFSRNNPWFLLNIQ